MIITFCGHSTYSGSANDEQKLIKLFDEISNGEAITFYFGGYGGFDAFCKDCAKKYKLSHPNTKLLFITQYLGKWLDNRKEHLQIEYDEIVYPEIESVPPKFAISKRNEWMAQQVAAV